MAVPTLESAWPTLTGRFATQGKKRLGGNSLADIVAQDVLIVYVTRAGKGMKVWADVRCDPRIAQFLERFFHGAENDDASISLKKSDGSLVLTNDMHDYS
ncbi:hypothetical protein hmeg3_11895 [Herbaspirillum sp. meg3]|nr:hypothetical protein hmeg3_11895 [Herbaspirillum sp. meg3]